MCQACPSVGGQGGVQNLRSGNTAGPNANNIDAINAYRAKQGLPPIQPKNGF